MDFRARVTPCAQGTLLTFDHEKHSAPIYFDRMLLRDPTMHLSLRIADTRCLKSSQMLLPARNRLICFCVNHKKFSTCWLRQSWSTSTSPETPNASPSTAIPRMASASATSPTGLCSTSATTTPKRWGSDFHKIYPDGISAEEIFAYTYAVLHDPVYRHNYKVDLLREFPTPASVSRLRPVGQDGPGAAGPCTSALSPAEPYPLKTSRW